MRVYYISRKERLVTESTEQRKDANVTLATARRAGRLGVDLKHNRKRRMGEP